MTEFEKDFYNRMILQLKEHEYLFSDHEHDFINSCTLKVIKKVPLSGIDYFNLGVLYGQIEEYKRRLGP